MLDIEKYMESFKESNSKRFEKQEENFRILTDKVKSFDVSQREYKKRLSRLGKSKKYGWKWEYRATTGKEFELYVIFPIFRSVSILNPFYVLGEIQIRKTVRDKRHSREIVYSLF